MRIGDDEQVELAHALHRFRDARHGIAAVAEHHHRLDAGALIDLLRRQIHRVEPPGRSDAGSFHVLLAAARLAPGDRRHFIEARLQPIVLDLPDARPMFPRAFDEAVIKRQRRHIEAEIGRALHIGVAAENVGAGSRRADIAGRETQDAEGAHVGGADGVLRRAHAPDQGRRLVLRKHFGDALQLLARHAGDALDFVGRPLRDFLAHIVHAVDALADEFLVFPAVLENVPEHAPDHRNVGARADAHIFRRVRRGSRKARLDDDHVGAVQFFARQNMLQRNRMRPRRIAAHDDHGLGIANVVVGIRLRAVAPGVGDAGDRRRMANARLMIDRVRAPERAEFAEQI